MTLRRRARSRLRAMEQERLARSPTFWMRSGQYPGHAGQHRVAAAIHLTRATSPLPHGQDWWKLTC